MENINPNAPDAAGQYDDAIAGESKPGIIVSHSIHEAVHHLPESLLRSRVRAWMTLESFGYSFWVGTFTDAGKWIYCSSEDDRWQPKEFRQAFAREVCRHVNKHCAHDGAWIVGWFCGGRQFYMLWKDKDGDNNICIEADKPFVVLQGYGLSHWENVCNIALRKQTDFDKNMEYGKHERKKVAQGERVSPEHFTAAPKLAMP